MLKILVLTCVLLFVVAIPALGGIQENWNDWNQTDTNWQIGFTILECLDWNQSLNGLHNNLGLKETNPILGENPSPEKVNQYFMVCLLGNYLIARALPQKYRRIWQVLGCIAEYDAISTNYRLGIKFSF